MLCRRETPGFKQKMGGSLCDWHKKRTLTALKEKKEEVSQVVYSSIAIQKTMQQLNMNQSYLPRKKSCNCWDCRPSGESPTFVFWVYTSWPKCGHSDKHISCESLKRQHVASTLLFFDWCYLSSSFQLKLRQRVRRGTKILANSIFMYVGGITWAVWYQCHTRSVFKRIGIKLATNRMVANPESYFNTSHKVTHQDQQLGESDLVTAATVLWYLRQSDSNSIWETNNRCQSTSSTNLIY